jgi:hypothetical protein
MEYLRMCGGVGREGVRREYRVCGVGREGVRREYGGVCRVPEEYLRMCGGVRYTHMNITNIVLMSKSSVCYEISSI